VWILLLADPFVVQSSFRLVPTVFAQELKAALALHLIGRGVRMCLHELLARRTPRIRSADIWLVPIEPEEPNVFAGINCTADMDTGDSETDCTVLLAMDRLLIHRLLSNV
jgi:hypothetical protein